MSVSDLNPTASVVDVSMASVMPTSSSDSINVLVSDTSLPGTPTLYSSYDISATADSSQFPMQHATQPLPGNPSPVTSTALLLFTTDQHDSQSVYSDVKSGITSAQSTDLAADISVTSASHVKSVENSDSLLGSVIDSENVVGSVTLSDSVIQTKSGDPDLTFGLGDTTPVIDSISDIDADDEIPTSDSFLPLDNSDIKPTDSVFDLKTTSKVDLSVSKYQSYGPSSGALYSTYTPSETMFAASSKVLDSVSLKTTAAAPVPPLTGKPMEPAAKGDSTILGGGLSDYIVYIGVPLCGLGILILLIVCIICIRRRKAKHKGSPTKNHVQDLWMNNSGSDVPLTSRNNMPEQNGGEAVLSEDIAKWQSTETMPALRKRKGKKKDKVKQTDPGEYSTDLYTGNTEGCTTYEAVFDFKAELSTHLPLKQGDRVQVHRKEAAGWWRGTAGDQTGWFPSNYVQAAPLDHIKTENEIETHDDSHVSSFMLKRPDTPNQRQSYISDSTNQRHSYIVDSSNHVKSNLDEGTNHRASTIPTEEEIEAEPIYCKIQPKEKRNSESDRSNSTTPTKSEPPVVKDYDTEYTALYPFVARVECELTINKGDIILCKESSDRNGWIRGTNESTLQEGWVPASYVQKIEKEELPALDLDLSSYKHLEVNTSMDDRQDLVGIVHKAIHTFTAEKAGDLEFEYGDLITVFQVLENGWWLGCKNKTVGWFPGAFVEMIDQPSSSPSPASSVQSASESPLPSEDTSAQQLPEDSPRTPAGSSPSTPTKSKLKPVRKAPLPPNIAQDIHVHENHEEPVENKPKEELIENKPKESKLPVPGTSRLRKMARPKIPPPLPPTKTETSENVSLTNNNNKESADENKNIRLKSVSDGSGDHIGPGAAADVSKSDLIKPAENHPAAPSAKKDKVKPPVPKRFIKPKLVTVPRTDVLMPDKDSLTKGLVSGDVMKLRSPPPPRPLAPKLGPIRAKLTEPKPLEDQMSCEEDDTYFQVTPQRKFDAIVRQESTENDSAVEDPYQRLSSFGMSSFGAPKQTKPKKSVEAKDLVPYQNKNDNASFVKTELPKEVDESLDWHQTELLNEEGKFVDTAAKQNHDHSDNESKAKSGISLTPKMKLSRLAPPKPVSSKLQETPDTVDKKVEEDKMVSGNVVHLESPSKLPMTSKPPLVTKVSSSPQEVPRQLAEDSNVFQYPNTSEAKSKESHGDVLKPDQGIHDSSFEADDERSRTDSVGKPPVAPKPKSGLSKLAKPKTRVRKDTLEDQMSDRHVADTEKLTDPQLETHSSVLTTESKLKSSESESETDLKTDKTDKFAATTAASGGSKIPLGSAITQQSPKQRGRKSNIPSPGGRTISSDRGDKISDNRKLSESESDNPVSPNISLKQKPESPRSGRTIVSKQVGCVEKQSLRNRSNSPAGRSGIPTTIRNRSNSPAPKSTGIPVARTNSPSAKSTPKMKPSGIVPPKKILNGIESQNVNSEETEHVIPDSPGFNCNDKSDDDLDKDAVSPKPDRPSKPPRVQQQKSQDSKPKKQGKSLLPIVHKTMETGNSSQNGVSPSSAGIVHKTMETGNSSQNGVFPSSAVQKAMETGSSSQNGVSHSSAGTKPKRGIPVAKPSRHPGQKSSSPDYQSDEVKTTLYQAVRGYTAQIDGELTFSEGTFVKELSDCDRPGWCVGMLADGTTGLYPAEYFKPSPVSAHSEA